MRDILRLHDIMKFTVSIIIVATFLLGCSLSLAEGAGKPFPRVITPLGTIEGYYKISNNGRRYEAYEGVPYAQPPIGELRFEVPRRVLPWTGVWMAKRYGPPCLQYYQQEADPTKMIRGSEDCLYLNIYTPMRDNGSGNRSEKIEPSISDLYPVILFIHGGGFSYENAGTYGPKILLDRNVTVVTFNYRVGSLGFLSTEDATVPGNMGLKDQAVAIRWVKDNIQSFGGDPSRITLFGHSSGAACVHYQYLTNLTKGLFHGGMSLSGTALNCWAQTEGSLEQVKRLAAMVGCSTNNIQGMVDCLKVRPGHQIVETMEKFRSSMKHPMNPFGPVVEKGGGEFTFIDKSPIEIIASGKVQDVPWITGIVSEEGLFPMAYYITDDKLVNKLNHDWETIAPGFLHYNYTIPWNDHQKVTRLMKEHYIGTSPFSMSNINETVKMVSDRMYVYDGEKAARLQAQVNQSPVLFYYFSYRGSYSESHYMSGSTKNFGVSHEDDLFYVMDVYPDLMTTEKDQDMQQKLIDLWVSFASNGIPNVGVEWPAVNRIGEEFRCLHIAGPTDISVIESTRFLGEKNFWNSIGFQENIYNHTAT